MTSMTLDLPRRLPWLTLPLVCIHGVVVAGLPHISVHQVVELPTSVQPTSVTMVAPTDLEPSQAVQSPPEPVVEPEPGPEPIPEPSKEAPVVVEKPKPKPKPKSKLVEKVGQPERGVKLVESCPASPSENMASAHPASSTATAAANRPTISVASGPCTLGRNRSQHPARTQALRIEGQVRVKFDVTPDDHVDNVQILSIKSANMFEREVKNTMRRWRYEPGKPGNRVVVNILSKTNGTTGIQ